MSLMCSPLSSTATAFCASAYARLMSSDFALRPRSATIPAVNQGPERRGIAGPDGSSVTSGLQIAFRLYGLSRMQSTGHAARLTNSELCLP